MAVLVGGPVELVSDLVGAVTWLATLMEPAMLMAGSAELVAEPAGLVMLVVGIVSTSIVWARGFGLVKSLRP